MRLDLLQVQKCIFYCDHFVVRFVNEGLGTLTINVCDKNHKMRGISIRTDFLSVNSFNLFTLESNHLSYFPLNTSGVYEDERFTLPLMVYGVVPLQPILHLRQLVLINRQPFQKQKLSNVMFS